MSPPPYSIGSGKDYSQTCKGLRSRGQMGWKLDTQHKEIQHNGIQNDDTA
jgi:hypothetical protein